MLYRRVKNKQFLILFIISSFPIQIFADSFNYNSYNNHGVLGLINLPSARFYDEGKFGVTIYNGNPDQKLTFTSSPYSWLEASFFYMNIQDSEWAGSSSSSYKDKGFNLKLKLKDEGIFPAIALGINDIAGTGYYGSEYIVGSYGIENIDMHFGLGWGSLNASENSFKNPFRIISSSFANRPNETEGNGGQFQASRYFSDKNASPFFGISYALNEKILLKLETDTTRLDQKIPFKNQSPSRFSSSIEYKFNKNFTLGLSNERDDYISLKFIYKRDAAIEKNGYKYNKIIDEGSNNRFDLLIRGLEGNGIGVDQILESTDFIGIKVTQFQYNNGDDIEDIIYRAKKESGINKELKTNYSIAGLQAYSEIDENFINNSEIMYQRQEQQNLNSSTRLTLRPFIAAREGFFKYSILAENDIEYVIKDNLFFSSNIKYSIKDNFEDLTVPPRDTFPAQVRSDIKEYLRNFEDRVIIGRAQLDYHLTPKKNNHVMFTAGILEEMFSGYGFEYLYFKRNKNYALGFEIFDVTKRDYRLRFGTLEYKNVTAHLNFYYRNYGRIPFDAKVSFGEYLAGDKGTTFEVSRSFRNGAEFGIFASFTDVSTQQFGEGSFDKGIFFNIPIYKDLVNYTWRPLTKDPAAKLIRKHNLHDLLVKFKSYEN